MKFIRFAVIVGTLGWLGAILLGVVEGLTEFIPVSSTGHLIIIGHIIGFTGKKADIFEIFIQLGAILAVVWLYRDRFFDLLKFNQSKGLRGLRGIYLLGLTTLPALIAGVLLGSIIQANLFNPTTVAIGLALGGVALILVERGKNVAKVKGLDQITPRQAITVGLFQALSLWPGVSRSGATIVGARLLGLDRSTAVEYSFLAAVPVMIAASGYDLLKGHSALSAHDFASFAIGFVVAFITAVWAIKFFVRLIKSRSLAVFGWYRLALAALVVAILH